MIKFNNDGKERYQSWEAEIQQSDYGGMGRYETHFTGYGATKEEAKQNLFQQINDSIAELENIDRANNKRPCL